MRVDTEDGAGFCPLEEFVQGDRYGRRPPALSLPGRRGLCCGVGAGFCPLGKLVQRDRYGRRPPGQSPGRAPRRGALPAAEQRGSLRPASCALHRL